MRITAPEIQALIAEELNQVTSANALEHIKGHLVEPRLVMRKWAGRKPQSGYAGTEKIYPCWTVMDHASGMNIAYTEYGWAPLHPWALVQHESENQWFDDNAFRTFLDAFFESLLSRDLHIWTIYKTRPDGTGMALMQEDSRDKTWEIIEALRIEQPESSFSCKAGIEYDRKSYLPQQKELTL